MKFFAQRFVYLLGLFSVISLHGQTTIEGTIVDFETQKPLSYAHISVLGGIQGTISRPDGTYFLIVDQEPPFSISFSYLGFRTEVVEITKKENIVDIAMSNKGLVGQEIVISASRLNQRILKTPVSIEKKDVKFIQEAASADYFDALVNLRGVQMTSSSLNFSSINTRGFAGVENTRFVQIIDGMDITEPTVNFNLGSIHALGELEVESMELLPGAASALYGPNALNGILVMHSKNPFEYEGLSVLTKQGVTSSDAAGTNLMSFYSMRYAKSYNDKLAFKVNFFYMEGKDWIANDYTTDRNRPESNINLSNEPDFDGLNLHGDETAIPVNAFGIGTLRRTGIEETVLLDNTDVHTIKANAAIHYRLNEDTELIGLYRFGGGSSIGQNYTKFAYRNFNQQFYKLELNSDNYFIRSYMNFTNVRKTYDVGALGAIVNEAFNPTILPDGSGWVNDYVTAFLGGIPEVTPNDATAARSYADRFMIDPVTGEFTEPFQEVVNTVRTTRYQSNPPGAQIYSKSNFWHSEFYYNFQDIKWANIIAGGNFRQYSLFSKGTFYNEAPGVDDDPERIFTSTYGGYVQASKTFSEKLNLQATVRYDNMKDFDGRFTPRFSIVYSPDKNNNIRANYQTGFRFPDMIQQFIYFPTPEGIALGGVPSTSSRYDIYEGGAWTQSSFNNFISQGGTIDPTTGAIQTNPGNVELETSNVSYLEPEELRSFEIGYNTIIGGTLLIDLNYYHTEYSNFLGNSIVVGKSSTTHQGQQIDAGSAWNLYTNSPAEVSSDGFGLGVTYNLPNNYAINGNYTYAVVSGDQPEGFLTQFNTPKHRINIGLSNANLTENLGFNINYRWQDDFLWESLYGVGTIPSYGVLDAQVNYKVPSLNATIKVGGTNIAGDEYRTNFGSPFVGQIYYVSLVIDDLLGL